VTNALPPESTTSSQPSVAALVAQLADRLRANAQCMATAESCTGGLIAGACTELSGSSDWFERGLVTYSNAAKSELLGVDPKLLAEHGAVSEPVARAMAAGALKQAPVHWSLAVTGVAGPTGGSAEKPVGTIWFAWAGADGVTSECRHFPGDRQAVRQATVTHALAGLLRRLGV
jgi:nicotinamide-nucleotide amidase